MYTAIRKSLDKRNREDKGFTLIELLVVIIIIGILAAIAIPIFLNQRKKAVDASMKSDLRSIATQMETFFTDDQVYPIANQVTLAAGPPAILTVGIETVTLSPGNTANVFSNATATVAASAICVEVQNSKGTRDHVWVSNAGGLQPSSVVDCNSTTFPLELE